MRDRIERFQVEACRQAGFLSRMNDPTFPFSGLYHAPEEVNKAVVLTLDYWNAVTHWPPVPLEPIHGIYQEKVTINFLLAAWTLLMSNPGTKRCVVLETDLFLGTAPTGCIRARVESDIHNARHAVVFDAGLFITLLQVCHGLSGVLYQNFARPSNLKFHDHNFDLTHKEIEGRAAALDYLAAIYLNLIEAGHSFDVGIAADFPYDEAFTSVFMRDAFTFIVAHEYGHIHLSHHDDREKKGLAALENEADRWAFTDVCSTVAAAGHYTISVFYSVMLLFFVYEMMYRIAHLKHFQRDYEQLPGKLLYHIYWPENRHLHPAARRTSIAHLIRTEASEVPQDFDMRASMLELLFRRIWSAISTRIAKRLMQQGISPMWNDYHTHHLDAYARYKVSPN